MSTHKTIAKNSLFLYFRMFLTMGVGLYTSRLVLEALGVVDYGIYGLVGGIVTMFAFLNSAMASATQRYLSIELGKGDHKQLQRTFNATLNIHICISILVLILAETVGLWFVNYKLIIPAERMQAANWVYQFSILAFLFEILQVPYNALMFAREHMKVYAYVSIVETILKLIIVFVLLQIESDKLILYSVLTLIVVIVVRMIYRIYCKINFEEARYQFYYNRDFYREILSYSGWNIFGALAMVARGQGSNILLNVFYGPVTNAAFGISNMVQGIIGNFISNFQVAVNPQIIKNYAKSEINKSIDLIFKSAKFSFFALLLIVIPLLENLKYIMTLWLNKVPDYVLDFVRLALIASLIDTMSNPLVVGAQATGKIKKYQIVIGILIISIFPITFILFKNFNNPLLLFYVFIGNAIVALLFRIFFLQAIMGLKVQDFIFKVVVRVICVTMIVLVTNYLINFKKADNFFTLLLQTTFYIFLVLVSSFIVGLDKRERKFVINFIKSKGK